jgi:hypothetical protein
MRHDLARKAVLAAITVALTAGSIAALAGATAGTVIESARGHQITRQITRHR